jgi:hypothetical protein
MYVLIVHVYEADMYFLARERPQGNLVVCVMFVCVYVCIDCTQYGLPVLVGNLKVSWFRVCVCVCVCVCMCMFVFTYV